jgi:threonine synthase
LSLAVARGFQRTSASPAVHCVQPLGNNTIAGPLRDGKERAQTSAGATTISALQIANVIDGDQALMACRASGGTGYLVSDDEIYSAQARMAREEGIFSEPAGAIGLAGVLDACKRGELDPDAVVVCLVTGTGFKDDAAIERMLDGQSCPLVASMDEFRQACLAQRPTN